MVQELHPALAATGRFEVKACLGSGGFGVVFEVHDAEVNARVALKWLRASDASTVALALARFKREFRSLADLSHPNLVRFRELITVDGEWFFTMDLVEGADLLRYLRPAPPPAGPPASGKVHQATASTLGEEDSVRINATPLTPNKPLTSTHQEVLLERHRPLCGADLRRVRSTFEQLASGLDALHAAGLIHRDIKPSNVLVKSDGQVVILDLGLVTEVGEDGLALTRTGNIVGTPAYMSPEQARGEPTTAASDWYSVGIILYQALTGRIPFDSNPTTFLLRKQLEDPVSPSDVVRGVPRSLGDLCTDLLARVPSKRPAGAAFLERLRQAIPLDRATGEFVLRRSPPSGPPRSSAQGGVFVGREAHVWALEEAQAEAERGTATIAFVHGSSGMGKTTLVRHFLDEIKRDRPEILVLEGRCYERESVPYKAVDSLVDSLCRYLRRLPEIDVAKLLPRDLAALARLFPVFLEIETDGRRSRPRIDAVQERRRAFEALRELIARIADRGPVIVFIDDLQWGDADSEPLLLTLLRAPDPPSVMFIAAYRSEDAAAAPLVRGLRTIASAGHVEACEIPVAELSQEASSELATRLLAGRGGANLAETLARDSCGSPLFLRQLAALRHTAQSIDLATALRQRVEALSPEARRLLEILAVAGRPVAAAIAARAAGIDEDVQGLLAQLRGETLVRTRGTDARDEVEIYHDRIREVVVAGLDATGLQTIHKKLARALSSTGDTDAEALAAHYAAAGENHLAAEFAEKAADRATAALAFTRAAEMYETALGLQTKSGADNLVTKLAEALVNAGRGRDAADRFLLAATNASPADSLELRRRAAEQLLFSGHIDEGLRVMDRILATMKMRSPATPVAIVVDLLWHRFLLILSGLRFRERSADAIARERLVRIDTCFSLAFGLLMVDPLRGAVFQARYLLLALAAGEPLRIAKGLALEAAYRSADGAKAEDRVDRLLARATSIADRLENAHLRALMPLMSGIARFLIGDPPKALALLDRASSQLREKCTGVAWELDNAAFFTGFALIHSGRLEELAQRLPAQLEDARTRGDLYSETLLRLQCSWLVKLAAGDVEGARRDLGAVPEEWNRDRFLLQNVWQTVNRVDVELYAGRPADAWALIDDAWPRILRSRLLRTAATRMRAHNARARAAIAAAWKEKATTEKRRLLDEALRLARLMARESWPRSLGSAMLVEAAAFAIQGDRATTVARLRRAVKVFDEDDAQSLFALSARFRLGQLLGDAEGTALTDAATKDLAARGVVDPTKMVKVFVPFSAVAG